MIFYDFRSSLSPQDCPAHLQNAFGREVPRFSTVRRWYARVIVAVLLFIIKFVKGPTLTAITEENLAAVRQLIEETDISPMRFEDTCELMKRN
ncbi:hypothetical protein EVAR_66742_1 [Eumeta japonica]|uniref:Uncharacterized protein n=1 Tax=Eumeta variegata TaxID=151549 RepID=A0A4C1SND1_EUMVA|nr:hypothetical protein EVAR_66742_1 [Eumeta japonica]